MYLYSDKLKQLVQADQGWLEKSKSFGMKSHMVPTILVSSNRTRFSFFKNIQYTSLIEYYTHSVPECAKLNNWAHSFLFFPF